VVVDAAHHGLFLRLGVGNVGAVGFGLRIAVAAIATRSVARVRRPSGSRVNGRPDVRRPLAKSTGKIRSSRMASCSAAMRCGSGIVPSLKNSPELVFSFGHKLYKSLVGGLGIGFERRGMSHLAAAVAVRLVEKRLHRHEIDYAVKAC